MLLSNLKTLHLGQHLAILETCTSTNDVVGKMADEGAPHGFMAIAESQSKGRGRQGRFWFSPSGGIWLTVLLRPSNFLQPLSVLPLIGALAIARSIGSNLRVKALVKWPNDVTVDDRKIAGVIVEARFKGNEILHALLGVGINANFEFAAIDALRDTATSLQTLLGAPINREQLICSILLETENLYESLCAGETDKVLTLLRKWESSRGRIATVKLENMQVSGVIDDYETLSSVRIITRQGLETVETSTVTSVEYQSN
jgi:BirA family biotin operon repressor/biotin-[acetyl-CoA-carboxylase] ligase